MINDYFQIHKYALNIFLKNIDTLISKYKGTKKRMHYVWDKYYSGNGC